MQVAIKIVLGFILVWFALLAFMPKTELYYKLEEELAKQGVKINEEHIDENPFELSITGLTLYVKGIEIAKIEKVNLFMTFFYNNITVEGVVMDDLAASQSVKSIKSATMNYRVDAPMVAPIHLEGSMGTIDGNITLPQKLLHLEVVKKKDIAAITKYLTKDAKGWYYETSF